MKYADLPEWVPMVRMPDPNKYSQIVRLVQIKNERGGPIQTRKEFYDIYCDHKRDGTLFSQWWSVETATRILDMLEGSVHSAGISKQEIGYYKDQLRYPSVTEELDVRIYPYFFDEMWDEDLIPLVAVFEVPYYMAMVMKGVPVVHFSEDLEENRLVFYQPVDLSDLSFKGYHGNLSHVYANLYKNVVKISSPIAYPEFYHHEDDDDSESKLNLVKKLLTRWREYGDPAF